MIGLSEPGMECRPRALFKQRTRIDVGISKVRRAHAFLITPDKVRLLHVAAPLKNLVLKKPNFIVQSARMIDWRILRKSQVDNVAEPHLVHGARCATATPLRAVIEGSSCDVTDDTGKRG